MLYRSIRTFLLYFISTALKSDKQFQKQVIFFLIYKDEEPDRNHSSGFRGQMAGQLTISKWSCSSKNFPLLNMLPEFTGHCGFSATCHIHWYVSGCVMYCIKRRKWIKRVHFLYFSDCSETENTKITTPLTCLQSTWSSQLFEMRRHVLLYAHTAHNFSLKMLGFQKK